MAKYLGVMTDEPQLTSVKLNGSGSTKVIGNGDISITITPASVAAATAVEQTFPAPGLLVGDAISVSPPSILAGVAPVCARISVAGTVAITFMNATAGALVPPAGAYQLQFTRS